VVVVQRIFKDYIDRNMGIFEIVRCLNEEKIPAMGPGAERYLDTERALTLSHMRQQLLSRIEQPTMADKMAADTAVLAYYNLLRMQGWIGNLCLVVERELFGQEPLNELHGPQVGEKLADDLRRLENQMFPLLDRAHRMMMRSLVYLDGRTRGGKAGTVTVERAGQVNIGSAIENHLTSS
jgi:hypothetical protein